MISININRSSAIQPAINFRDFNEDEQKESPFPILIVTAVLTGMMLLGIFFYSYCCLLFYFTHFPCPFLTFYFLLLTFDFPTPHSKIPNRYRLNRFPLN